MNHVTWLVAIAIGLVVVAALLRLIHNGAARRLRLRRTALLFVPYVALAALTVFGEHLGSGLWLSMVRIAADFVAILLAINLAATLLFDVALPAVRLKAPEILHDLSVGATYVIALVWLMHRSGVNLASIVATSAVATAVIGLSLQSTLGSVIGGLALQVDDSLNEGDWIELENKTQAQVKKVRWRHTVLETRDWDTLLVPNNQLLNQTIKLLGKREGYPVQRRMWVHFNVDYRTAPREVIGVVDQALSAPIAGVAQDPPPTTICVELAQEHNQSSGRYATRYWLTDLARDTTTSSAVRERIHAALRRAQIPLAIPAAALFVSNEDGARLERKQRQASVRAREGLTSIELFRGLDEAEIDTLAKAVKVAPFAAGEMVTRQGAEANWLYVLTRGQVEIRVNTPDGGTKRVHTLSAPDFFGEMALLTGGRREASVIAQTTVECLRVDRAAFGALLERRPALAQEVAEILARRRVALEAVRDNLDAASRNLRVEGERHRILNAVQEFFGLRD
ncbi:MAG TPA: mechanosensitive ion channel family protein [Polyangiaceae bacterium]|nr:mechanosensitive ion channel family protein [Polyangiaceae bacterium]